MQGVNVNFLPRVAVENSKKVDRYIFLSKRAISTFYTKKSSRLTLPEGGAVGFLKKTILKLLRTGMFCGRIKKMTIRGHEF